MSHIDNCLQFHPAGTHSSKKQTWQEASEFTPCSRHSYLVRLFLQQALAATVGGAVLHLAGVTLLEPCRHQTPAHRRQHALVHCGFLSNTDKAGVNYRSQIKSDSSLPV